MAKSPIKVDPKLRFGTTYSFSGITDPLSEANCSFDFEQDVRIELIHIQTNLVSYKDPVRIYKKFKGTDGVDFTELVLYFPCIREIKNYFPKGYSMGKCDRLYFESSSTASKNIIIEVTKWVP